MENRKIVILGSDGMSTKMIFNALEEKFGVHKVIIENTEPKGVFIKRRIKRLGLLRVFGQLVFQAIIPRILRFFSKKRIKEIFEEGDLNTNDIPSLKLININSINDKSTIKLLIQINPDLIIVNGTRIINKSLLNSVNCKLINIHVGITPKYRGVHGAYWALVNNDIANSGVTIHFVDEGIDTGEVIDQIQVVPNKTDNFSTYPLLQTSYGIKILLKAVENYFNNTLTTKIVDGESKLWYHPTIFQYMYNRVVKNVK